MAVGCLDKTLWLWKLPETLIFKTLVANKIKSKRTAMVDWHIDDIVDWLSEIGLAEISQKIMTTSLNGRKLLSLPTKEICSMLELSK